MPRRILPAEPLPPYSYVPGHFPHPISDPDGHAFGHDAADVRPLAPDRWLASIPFCRAIDLFNCGYYWEAHEAWEQLWIAAGRTGTLADFLKGLIKLAAAGVKLREGNGRGVERHATRADQLFSATRQKLGTSVTTYCGLCLPALHELTAGISGGEWVRVVEPDLNRMLFELPVSDDTRPET